MKNITKKLDFSNQTLEEMNLNSKKFYNLIKKRRSVREFKKDEIDLEIIQNAILAAMFDDEELNESQKKFKTAKYTRMYNNMANSVLRGTGMTGAVLAAVKDAGLKYYQLKNKENPLDKS